MKIHITFISTGLLLFFNTQSYAGEIQNWSRIAIETFEAYCFRPAANYIKIEEYAAALKFKKIPAQYAKALLGENSKSGKAYYVKWDKTKNISIMLDISLPETCSVGVLGIEYDEVKSILHENYKLKLAFKDDVGLQNNEMYIPGGKFGNKQEARNLGMLSVIYPKKSTGYDGFTISYIPPKTVINHVK